MIRIFFTFLLFFTICEKAQADEIIKKAYLSCDAQNNAAMVRLDAGPISKPRYIKFPAPYAKYEYLNNLPLSDQCTFRDGRTIILSFDVGQAYPYGQGGADPEAYFSLKVGNKYAYYHRIFYTNFRSEFIDPIVILITGQDLVSCKGPSGFSETANYAEQHIVEEYCSDESKRLISGVENYPSELAALKASQAHEAYKEISKIPELCNFVKTNRIHFLADEKKYNSSSYKRTPLGSILESEIDINNDGNIDKVLQFVSTSHYTDGAYFVVGDAESVVSIKQCVLGQACPSAFQLPDEGSGNVDEFVQNLTRYWPNAIALGGEKVGYSTRYTNLYPIAFANKNFIYFQPLDDTSFPRASVGEVLSDMSVDTVCTYKRLPNGR